LAVRLGHGFLLVRLPQGHVPATLVLGIVVTATTACDRGIELGRGGVSLIAQTGLQFDLSTPQGRLIAALMASLAEFERDLLRERIRSGIAAAHARGVKSGRRPGQRVKADKFISKVLQLVSEGHSYRSIAKELHLDKNTVNAIVKRYKQSLLHKSRLE